jgi:hypothetical protein
MEALAELGHRAEVTAECPGDELIAF